MMKVKADCKINLHLKVTGRRPDGYHTIETIFQQIDLGDELELEMAPAGQIIFETSGLEISGCSENICEKAARLLNHYSSTDHGCRIFLQKIVPLGAGLGGGSSDAAAVLKGLNRLWDLNHSDEVLEKLGVQLGADVPFFIKGGTAFACGIGEELQQIKPILPSGWLVLINPGVHVNTGIAYKNIKYDLTNYKINSIFATVLENDLDVGEIATLFENDFEHYVFSLHPEVGKIRQVLAEQGSEFCRMSGSGSTVFGYFAEKSRAEEALKQFDSSWFKQVIRV